METNSTETTTTSNDETCAGIDIAFVIDATGSMSSYIAEAKKSVKDIIDNTETTLKELLPDTYQDLLKFSIIAYRDHPPQDETFVTEVKDFNTSKYALEYLSGLAASGGGDFPEAVLDGMYDAANKISWRKNTEKMLFLILDAPPHGIRYGTSYDCPCGYTEKDFMPYFTKNEIKIHIIKPPGDFGGSGITKMIQIFEEFCPIEVKDFSGNNINESISYSSVRIESCIKSCDDSPMLKKVSYPETTISTTSTSVTPSIKSLSSTLTCDKNEKNEILECKIPSITSFVNNSECKIVQKECKEDMSSYISGKINDKIKNKITKLDK